MFKLGIGWLLRVPGEIFKLLDDPLGDTCSISRCALLSTWMMTAQHVAQQRILDTALYLSLIIMPDDGASTKYGPCYATSKCSRT